MSLLFDVDSDFLTYNLLNLKLFLKLFDLVSNLILLPGIESLHALKLSFDFSLLVASLELTLSFGLIDSFLESGSFIAALLGFFGELILFLFEVFVDPFDLSVEVFVKFSQFFVFAMFLKSLIYLGLEVAILLVLSHLVHELFGHGCKIGLVTLDELLVTSHIWIVFQLSHELLGLVSQLT